VLGPAAPSVSVPSVSLEFSEKLEKVQFPSRSIASPTAKFEISPQIFLGLARYSVPPPVKPMSWAPTVLLLPTVESN
jgi:hypothetical protein